MVLGSYDCNMFEMHKNHDTVPNYERLLLDLTTCFILGEKLLLYELIANCKSQHELQLFNASLIQLQVEFVRSQPPVVRDLIRLVKHWKRTSFGATESLAK